MQTIEVKLGANTYPIYIGSGLLAQPALIQQHLTGKQLLFVTNTTLAPLYLGPLAQAFSAYHSDQIILPDGEEYKTIASWQQIIDVLLEHQHDRSTTVCALGGGVIGDMTGFAAACYRRGVNYLQLPTSLLAQVDAAIGGKTAVNHPLGKNMIGAFHQPRAVIIDIDVLKTLPAREFKAGLAEVIKYGLIQDASFYAWIEANLAAILDLDSQALVHMIQHSVRIKAEFVSQDETEKGARALLNLGHTFGHAIEAYTAYKTWLHGEAVAVGMLMAVDLSVRQGWIEQAIFTRLHALITQLGLPIRPPKGMLPQDFMHFMAYDKKVLQGELRLVLLQDMGHAIITNAFMPEYLAQTLETMTEEE